MGADVGADTSTFIHAHINRLTRQFGHVNELYYVHDRVFFAHEMAAL